MKGNTKQRTVMLQITEACNLNCIYCYQPNKSDKTIDLNSAKQRITKYVNESKDYDEVIIDLTGGEVFLRFDLLRELCEWAWKQKWPIPILFNATTNGTLVHGDIQKWLIDNNRSFSLGLSLDGTKEMHDINRTGSYNSIDFDFFLRNWPEQPVKMTISPESLPTLSQGIIKIHELGFMVHANFAYMVDWSKPEYVEILNRELYALSSFYLKHPELQTSSIIDMPLWTVIEKKQAPIKWCGTGTHMIAIDISGQEYPCQMFMPNSMNTYDDFKSFNFGEPLNLQDEYCTDCNLLPVCPTCYGASIIRYGNPAIRDKDMCRLTKIRAYAASYLMAKKILNGSLKIDDYRMKRLIEAIEKIQSVV